MPLLILWKCDNGVDDDNYFYVPLTEGKQNWYGLNSVTEYLLQTHIEYNLSYQIWFVSVKKNCKMLLKLCVLEGFCLSYSGDIFPSAKRAEIPFFPKFYTLLLLIFNLQLVSITTAQISPPQHCKVSWINCEVLCCIIVSVFYLNFLGFKYLLDLRTFRHLQLCLCPICNILSLVSDSPWSTLQCQDGGYVYDIVLPKLGSAKSETCYEYQQLLIDRFACHKCGNTYKQKGHLTRHLNHECGMEPQYRCPRCPKRYRQNTSLKFHMYKHHCQHE